METGNKLALFLFLFLILSSHLHYAAQALCVPRTFRYLEPSSGPSAPSTPPSMQSPPKPPTTGSTPSTTPVKEVAKPSSPVTTPSTPSTPKTTPSAPSNPPTTPSTPSAPKTTPSAPSTPPTIPSTPSTPPTSPSTPPAPKTTPSAPSTPPTTPSTPSAPKTTPSTPSTPPTTPSTPSTPKPVTEIPSNILGLNTPSPEIKKLCEAQDEPSVCFTYLPPFLKGKFDPNSIIIAELDAIKNHTQVVMDMTNKVTADPTTDKDVVEALNLCKENYETLLADLEDAVKAVGKHDVGSLQSQASAFMSEVSTCQDTFSEVTTTPSPLAAMDDITKKLAVVVLITLDYFKW